MHIEPSLVELIITVVTSVIASSGVWTFVSKMAEKKDSKTQLLIGLAHDRILHLCEKYIERGGITKEEYDDLHEYLYTPYSNSGGNGSAERMVNKVDQLPLITQTEAYQLDGVHNYLRDVVEGKAGSKGVN